MAPAASRPAPGARRATSARATLLVVLAGFLALPMSMSGASVAIPRIAAGLGTGGAAAQWVVTAYFLTASALMLISGSLADAVGRRRVYRAGAVAYATGSLAAALAPGIGVLLAARVLTGAGAAGVMAAGGALVAATFSGRARTRAFAAVGTTAGLGLALGPPVSGWLVDALGWRLGFAVFALAGLGLVAGTWALPESRAATRPRVDWAGAALIASGLAGTLLAVSQGPGRGWTDPLVLGAAAVGVLGIGLAVAVERRVPHPVLELRLLRRRRFMGWLLAAGTMALGFGGVLSFLPSYLQSPAGYSATAAGAVMLLPTIPMVGLPPLAAAAINRGASPGALVTGALLLLAAGNAWLTVLAPDVGLATLAGPLLAVGAGVGLASGTIDAQAMDQIDEDHVGMAAGMLNTVRAAANALVLALFGAALVGLLSARLGSSELAGRVVTGNVPAAGADTLAAHLTDVWHLTLWAATGVCVAGAVATGVLVRDGARRNGR
ncbi:MFS transporter [Krasilnikoviella flava]|uniref:Drug resistance transporter, EmrB/QacA subfamily n=1 Tax=Krasilnikoviella flava TaxID=526729 RepID=A0A1T5IMU3_9MICO|nr:MFS transporter [Krasilnikoviella flava]SKC40372.1 drug resistance transporter, EmrB/QacA subfamily [Krasilnikoviella flava]